MVKKKLIKGLVNEEIILGENMYKFIHNCREYQILCMKLDVQNIAWRNTKNIYIALRNEAKLVQTVLHNDITKIYVAERKKAKNEDRFFNPVRRIYKADCKRLF